MAEFFKLLDKHSGMLTLLASVLVALIQLNTRLAISRLYARILENFATKRDLEKLEERVQTMERPATPALARRHHAS